MSNQNIRTIKSAERVFDILEFIRAADGGSVSDVARELEIAVSTAHQYLKTLELREYLVEKNGEYYLSLRFLDYGESARTRTPAHRFAKEKVAELAKQTGERAQFVVMEHGHGVVLYTSFGDHAVQTNITVGRHVKLHATAAGKAILASLPVQQTKEIIEASGLEPVTENTITDRDELLAELERIRDTGIAYNKQEDTHGLCAIGVAVNNPSDGVLGALSVSGPVHRFTGAVRDEKIPNLLLGEANELELRVEYES